MNERHQPFREISSQKCAIRRYLSTSAPIASALLVRDIFMLIPMQMPRAHRARLDAEAVSGGHVSRPVLRTGLRMRDEEAARRGARALPGSK
jgi:hypothetical protein